MILNRGFGCCGGKSFSGARGFGAVMKRGFGTAAGSAVSYIAAVQNGTADSGVAVLVLQWCNNGFPPGQTPGNKDYICQQAAVLAGGGDPVLGRLLGMGKSANVAAALLAAVANGTATPSQQKLVADAGGDVSAGHESGNTDTSCGHPALAKGSTDSGNIRLLQTLINQSQASGSDQLAIDGIFGPDTEAAVVAFNTGWGLRGGAKVDCDLWNALLNYNGGGGGGGGGGQGKVTCPQGTYLAADGVSCLPAGTGNTNPPGTNAPMSTTTMALLGGAGLLAVLLLTKK